MGARTSRTDATRRPDRESPGAAGAASPGWHRWARAGGATLTLLIAVWGAVTGTAAWLEGRRIDVRVSPAAYPADENGGPIEVALVNRSQRGTALLSGRVLLDGGSVGTVVAVVTDTPLDWRLRPPEQIAARARPLPITLEPSQSMHVVLFWNVTDRRARDRLRAGMRVEADPEPAGSTKPRLPVAVRLGLRLGFDPGGARVAPVGVVRPRAASRAATESSAYVQLRRGHVIALAVSRGPAAPNTEPSVGVLRVWSERAPAPVRRATRPIGASGETLFPLRRLPRGRYSWSVTGAGIALAGVFRTPCTPSGAFRREPRVPIAECAPLGAFGP